jgi:hypothetical protein
MTSKLQELKTTCLIAAASKNEFYELYCEAKQVKESVTDLMSQVRITIHVAKVHHGFAR